jgi:GTP-binding protein Era
MGKESQTEVVSTLPADHRAGYVAIIGRPNVGKSTLINQILGQKIAIVTPKPQTTRGRILGIKTAPHYQVVLIDTPGLHDSPTLLNRRMKEAAESALGDADVVLWVIDTERPLTPADARFAKRLVDENSDVCVALNKIDRKSRADLLPILAAIDALLPGRHVVPVSALDGTNVDELVRQIVEMLPLGPRFYGEEVFTDQTERALVQEVVREKVLLETRHEVPYAVAVTVETFEEKGDLAIVDATIHVERESQKAIIIGAKGVRIKKIGTDARIELEEVLGRRVFLRLFVRVQEKWTTNPARLKEFGL